MYKILTVVGARPHFVKAKMVSEAIARSVQLTEVLLHTGQHYDHALSGAFFEELELPTPQYNLEIGSGRQAWQLGQMILGIDQVIEQEKPDMVIVYGDTNSTAAGAIAAAKNDIPLAHIEAGLREFNKGIPEEVNKLLTDAIADLYFCPTPTGVRNLEMAGITRGVYLVGDVGIDLVSHYLPHIEANLEVLKRFGLQAGQYHLMTCHRASNTNQPEPLRAILEAIAALDYPVLFPIHPRTRQAIASFQLEHLLQKPHIAATGPLGFLDTQSLLRHARMAITDSGGIIKEAYFHRVPAIIIDRQTEWLETVAEGWHQVTGPHTQKILQAIATFIAPATHSNFLGDGHAAEKIARIIESYWLC